MQLWGVTVIYRGHRMSWCKRTGAHMSTSQNSMTPFQFNSDMLQVLLHTLLDCVIVYLTAALVKLISSCLHMPPMSCLYCISLLLYFFD